MNTSNTDRPDDVDRTNRVLPGLTSISKTIRKTIIYVAKPLSTSRSDPDNDSANSTPGFPEKLRRWNSNYKGADARSISSSFQLVNNEPRTLMALPHEVQILVLRYLEFGDIERLRRASKYWHDFATPKLIRSIHGPDVFREILIQHCRVCLTYCPRDVTRIVTTRVDPGYPLSSRCIQCTVQSQDGTVRIGRKVKLGDSNEYWACRWCGWPITRDQTTGNLQFHKNCYDKYAVVLLAFFCLGWVQFCIGIVAAALSWHYLPHTAMMLAPTIVGFVLMWVCIVLIIFRGPRVRTYSLALMVELIIVGLWVSLFSISPLTSSFSIKRTLLKEPLRYLPCTT